MFIARVFSDLQGNVEMACERFTDRQSAVNYIADFSRDVLAQGAMVYDDANGQRVAYWWRDNTARVMAYCVACIFATGADQDFFLDRARTMGQGMGA